MTVTDDGPVAVRRNLPSKHIFKNKIFVQIDKRSHCIS